jgi:hypothetical protein
MQIKNLEQALKLQEEFKAKLLQSVEALRKGKAPPLDAIVKDREKLIARSEARLDTAVKEREAMERHWDERIARLKDDVQHLHAQVRDIKKRVSGQESEAVEAEPEKTDVKKKTKG